MAANVALAMALVAVGLNVFAVSLGLRRCIPSLAVSLLALAAWLVTHA